MGLDQWRLEGMVWTMAWGPKQQQLVGLNSWGLSSVRLCSSQMLRADSKMKKILGGSFTAIFV
jgi:hypothetical protein